MNKSRIVRVFLETNMVCQHAGLKAMALSHKVNIDELESGEHAVFVNKALNYSFNGVISYLYQPKGRLDLHMIEAISRTFDDRGTINFEKAAKQSLVKRLQLT